MGREHILSRGVSFPIFRLVCPPYLCSRFAQYIYGVYLGLNGEFVLPLRIKLLIRIFLHSFTFSHTDRASSRATTTAVCGVYSIVAWIQCRSMGA
jgi:hypothetical protein